MRQLIPISLLLCHWQLAASALIGVIAIGCDDGSMTNNGRGMSLFAEQSTVAW